MPELFSILIKINVALVLFCAGYYLVLRKLTFYTLNRVYLVGAIIFSSVYPFVDINALVQSHQQIVEPVQNIVTYWKAPVKQLVEQAGYWNWLEAAFWIGAVVFACRLAIQMLSLYKIYRGSKTAVIGGQKVRLVSGNIGPFSFWQSIYINPKDLSDTDIKNIIEHEQVHVKEWHTLDILLSEISVIFYWFNPGVWLMKRAVRENIEFITDRKILLRGTDSKAYQYSLLNVTFNQPAPAITSNFNFSTLKKRIIMMNAKRSSKLNLTRYALLVPVVIVSLLTLTLAKAETLNVNKVIKQVAVTVGEITPFTLKADTTPVEKTAATNKASTTQGKSATTKPATSGKTQIRIREMDAQDSVIYIIDGKVVSAETLNTLNPDKIETVNVIKDNASTYLNTIPNGNTTPADKVKGVVAITTKKNTADAPINKVEIVGYGADTRKGSDTNRIVRVRNFYGDKDPIVIVDGEMFENAEDILKKLSPDDIQTVAVLKGRSAESIYGDKAKNGAIVITTKKSK